MSSWIKLVWLNLALMVGSRLADRTHLDERLRKYRVLSFQITASVGLRGVLR